MNNNIISHIGLKTLPLSLSGVTLGIMLAAADYHVDWKVALFLLLAVSLFHFLSNVKNAQEHSPESYKVFSKILLALAILCGLMTIYFTFGTIFILESFILMIFGYFAVSSGLRHNIGAEPDSTRRMSGLYAFAFLGLMSFGGAYYICSHTFGSWILLLPAACIGLFSTTTTDLGRKPMWRIALISAGWLAMTAYSCMRMFDFWHFLFVLTLPLFAYYLYVSAKSTEQDSDMRFISLTVLAFVLTAGFGFLVYLF